MRRRRRPPLRFCDGCGAELGYGWGRQIYCEECRRSTRQLYREAREARRTERLDSLASAASPGAAPHDRDEPAGLRPPAGSLVRADDVVRFCGALYVVEEVGADGLVTLWPPLQDEDGRPMTPIVPLLFLDEPGGDWTDGL